MKLDLLLAIVLACIALPWWASHMKGTVMDFVILIGGVACATILAVSGLLGRR